MRRGAKPAKAKVEARLPVAGKSRNKGSRVRDLEKRLAEALEQQTATAEILRVICSSPANLTPVLQTIAENATRVCGGYDASVFLREGDSLRLTAHHGPIPVTPAMKALPLTRGFVNGRAILERSPVHVYDLSEAAEFSEGRELARQVNYKTTLAVPLLRGDIAIGTLCIRRVEIEAFSQQQIALLQTFADQAVIAIENVRLFKELQQKNSALTQAHAQVTETLGQQTATSQILRVIASSPTDLQPVLDVLVESAGRLCEAADTFLLLVEGDQLRVAALHPFVEGAVISNPIHRGWVAGRAVVDGRTVHVEDLANAQSEFPLGSEIAARFGHRTAFATPLVRKGVPIGALFLRRREVRRFSDKEITLLQTFADQAVIAIENVRLFTELQEKNRALTQAHAQVTEALDKQTATSEILRVISQSPTDVQPVFNAIVRNGMHLTGAARCVLFGFDGEILNVLAMHNVRPEGIDMIHRIFPSPASQRSAMGRAVLDRTIAHIPDVTLDSEFGFQDAARAVDFRAVLAVPMMREDVAIGAIVAQRSEPGAFSDSQVQLLTTFADQAVIAIENVRLFNETKEALERQTATSAILRVISRSPTDIQPVLETIVEHAGRVCGAFDAIVFLVEGDRLVRVAHRGPVPITEGSLSLPIDRDSVSGVAILDCRTVYVEDILASREFPRGRAIAERSGFRTTVSVPLVREGAAIGTLVVRRIEVHAFTNEQIALLETFADQAVIAIENVRLFKELQSSNHDLTTALDQQTATSEILRVISRSPTDVQPVFDTIVENAARLCGADDAILQRVDGDVLRVAAHFGSIRVTPDGVVMPITPDLVVGRAVLERKTFHIHDMAEEHARGNYSASVEHRRLIGYRTLLITPLVRENAAVGAIVMRRLEVRDFSDAQIDLLRTFADQAVIAIENVRLFTELEARTKELTRSVGELRALGEVGQAISSTLDLQTVLSTIVTRATQLAGVDAGLIYEYDEQRELFEPRATDRLEEEIVRMLVATPVRKGQGATGRLAVVAEPVQLADIRDVAAPVPVRDAFVQAGYRALLAVPLIREGHLIGGLTVLRKAPGEFVPATVDLLRTFATQSALAIQNARLFREIADKSRQLEVASQHKSEFLANMSHELRTPLNAIIGFSEVLSERMFGELNEKQEEYLKDIYASGTHLLSLINDILDLSKIEAGRMELELTDFHLPQAIDNALILVRERAGRRGITLEHSVDERLGEIRGDERKVKQVLLNLLSNALKFTPEGGRVEVRAGTVDGMAEIAVSDTGVGIAPEDQEAVFEEFRQVGTAEKKAEGTGLGLTLCRKFVELHGGKIWVTSQLGVGSTFTFRLPVRRGE